MTRRSGYFQVVNQLNFTTRQWYYASLITGLDTLFKLHGWYETFMALKLGVLFEIYKHEYCILQKIHVMRKLVMNSSFVRESILLQICSRLIQPRVERIFLRWLRRHHAQLLYGLEPISTQLCMITCIHHPTQEQPIKPFVSPIVIPS